MASGLNIKIYSDDKKPSGDFAMTGLEDAPKARTDVLHEVVRWQQVKRRAGTHKTKVRHEVRGGGKKPWKQKGTGRARQGSIRSPLWVGGGKVFGPVPRSYEHKLNKKTRDKALKQVLSALAQENRIIVVDKFGLSAPKTSWVNQFLQRFDLKAAVFVDSANEALEKSVRNIQSCRYLKPEGVNVEDLLKFGTLVVSKAAIEQINQRLSKPSDRGARI